MTPFIATPQDPDLQRRSQIPSRRSARTPRQYLSLEQHRDTLSREEILLKYAETMERDYEVKIPKPLYAEATATRRQSMARNARRILGYSITPAPAGKGRGPVAALKTIAAAAPVRPPAPALGGKSAQRKLEEYEPSEMQVPAPRAAFHYTLG